MEINSTKQNKENYPSVDIIFYLASFAFAAGVLWRSLARVDFIEIVWIGVAYILLVLFFFILKKDWGMHISVMTLALLLGITRFQIADLQPPAFFENLVDKTFSFTAIIVDEPTKNASQVKLVVETKIAPSTYNKNPTIPNTGIVIFTKSDLKFQYGDLIKVTGKLEKPANFMTDQDMEFDYVNYLRKDGIFYSIKNPSIEIISSGHGNFVKRWLFSWREKFDAVIAKNIAAPESIVLGGIILGERYAFSPQLRQIFMDTGTIHIVTIGGYHVTLVAQWIMKIFSFLPKYAGIGSGIIGIFLYVIATGGAQTSIRAGIMATLALFATATGRTYASGRALIFAATIMILINPFVLVYDVSFELSFMATIAIIFLSPLIEPYFTWIPWKWLRDIIAITSSMYVFALPFVLYRIGNLSLVALPANIVIVPLMPITMIAGFVTGFAGFVSPWLAIVPGKIATSLLYFQISAVAVLARLPFAAITITGFSLPLVIVIYGIFFWIFFKENSEGGQRFNFRIFVLLSPLLVTFAASGFLYYSRLASNQAGLSTIQKLLSTSTLISSNPDRTAHHFLPDQRTASNNCKINGAYPDHSCTPGAVFPDATAQDICVKGYTATVRSVSDKTKKQVFEEYGLAYPQPAGTYEVDHFIPLALGGANDISNLFPEAAKPTPGFHEKDIVEVFLQGEVCSGRADLSAAQRQISTDWLEVYKNIPFEEIQKIKKKYGGGAVQ